MVPGGARIVRILALIDAIWSRTLSIWPCLLGEAKRILARASQLYPGI